MIGNLEKFIRLLVLISFDVKTIKVEVWNKNKNNKLMSLRLDDEKLLEKYRSIWIKIGDLKKMGLNALPVYDDRYMNTKTRVLSLH